VETGRAARSARAVLVSVAVGRSSAADAQDAQQELRQLAGSAGFVLCGDLAVRRERPDPRFFVGSGKVAELAALMQAQQASVAVFDVALSPAQQRNLERELDALVLDRSDLILDIFQQRARSSAGRLQVELAQLEHLSTRLVRGWTHLERQRGGLGKTGGPGEKQIELDRRLIAARMKLLRKRLAQLHQQRRTQRRARARGEVFSVSLVGYTNAGKSTLFNALTGAGAFAADQLFATLDTTARRCFVAPDVPVVLADTVGFIRGLPHQLVEAFKSTLEESIEADLLLHVVDAANPARDAQIATVQQVLEDIGAAAVPQLQVFNKIDCTERAAGVERNACATINRVFVSAATGAGLDGLRTAIAERARATRSVSGDFGTQPDVSDFQLAGLI
jgi:GTP-binding protein HflX